MSLMGVTRTRTDAVTRLVGMTVTRTDAVMGAAGQPTRLATPVASLAGLLTKLVDAGLRGVGEPTCPVNDATHGVCTGSGAPYTGRGGGSGVVSESSGRMPARSPRTTSFSSAKTVSLPKNVYARTVLPRDGS